MTMLDRMRRHKSWLKWSLGLVVLAFVIFYIPDFLSDPAASVAATDTVASIDDYRIRAEEFRRTYQAQLQAYNRIKNIAIPNMYYRTDIGDRWAEDSDKLHTWGYLR